MTAASLTQLQADLGALEDSAHRAGVALACCYSGADEYEAEVIRVRRAAGAFDRHASSHLRLLLSATVIVSLALLILLAF